MNEELYLNNNCPNCTKHTPKEAYLYIPSKESQMKYDENNPENTVRVIFEKQNNEFLPHENKYYNEFIEYINENHKDDFVSLLPENWTESDTRKYLQACKFDFELTIERIKTNINYKVPELPFDSIKEILLGGFLYMHGLDSKYRPIMVCKVSKFMTLFEKYEIENFKSAVQFFLQYLKKHIFIPGQVENWIIIADLTGVSMWSPPTNILPIFEFLQTKYYYRLAKLHIYGMSSILNFCWKIVKNLIDKTTAAKFSFLSSENDIKENVLSYINPSQIEKRYGGTAENIDDNIEFPFILPSNQYQIENKINNEIISEEKYLELVNEKKLTAISPYIKNDNNNNKCKHNKNDIVVNDITFYECESEINIETNFDSRKFNLATIEDDVEDEKIVIRSLNKDLNSKKEYNCLSSKNESTTAAATEFELNENKANCCECSTCLIF